jgi:hypothetical protein
MAYSGRTFEIIGERAIEGKAASGEIRLYVNAATGCPANGKHGAHRCHIIVGRAGVDGRWELFQCSHLVESGGEERKLRTNDQRV